MQMLRFFLRQHGRHWFRLTHRKDDFAEPAIGYVRPGRSYRPNINRIDLDPLMSHSIAVNIFAISNADPG